MTRINEDKQAPIVSNILAKGFIPTPHEAARHIIQSEERHRSDTLNAIVSGGISVVSVAVCFGLSPVLMPMPILATLTCGVTWYNSRTRQQRREQEMEFIKRHKEVFAAIDVAESQGAMPEALEAGYKSAFRAYLDDELGRTPQLQTHFEERPLRLRDIPIDDSPIVETTANIEPQDIPGSFGSSPKTETIAATVVQATGQDQDAPRIEQNRFIDVLMDNPYQSRAIIAGQRTGKTYGAAVATWCLSQDGTAIYYINLFDHGQGNREAFSHARCVIGDLDELNRDDGADLVADAIQLIHEFRKSSDAILVVDEWAVLGHENQNTPGIDSLWKALGAETSRSCSNGIGNGRAIWGIAPSFKADPLKKEAKTLKECAPMILSITPGSSIPWTNPRSGKVTQVKAQPQIIGDVLKNWPGCCASLPSDEQSRQWRREGVERVYWYQGQWHPMGSCPALPKPKAKPPEPVSKTTDFPVDAIGRAVGVNSESVAVIGLTSADETGDPWKAKANKPSKPKLKAQRASDDWESQVDRGAKWYKNRIKKGKEASLEEFKKAIAYKNSGMGFISNPDEIYQAVIHCLD